MRTNEPGKPAAALAIIATIFAVAIVIKLLPPSTRHALLLETPELPSRPLVIWIAGPEPVFARASRRPAAPDLISAPVEALPQPLVSTLPQAVAESLPRRSAEREGGTLDPGLAPILQATTFVAVPLATEVTAESAEIETTGNSPLVMPFAKTGSALRFAFAKTGSAIKAAASGTAGVFVSNP